MAKITGKGSFAGVPFLIEETQSIDGGRRLVKHEYPLRDEGLNEDLGKKARTYNVACLVIGDDHIKQAEKLIEALEKGRGELKHPYFKNINVCVETYKAHYSTGHQRVTRFDITFADDIQENAPKLAKNTQFSALTEYANAINTLSDEFAEQIAEINEFVDLLVDNPFTQLVDSMVWFIENTFESINSVVTGVGDIKTKAESMKNRMMNLIRAPSLLGKELQSLVQFKQYKGISPKQELNQRAITTNIIHNTISEATKSKKEMPKPMFDAIVNAKRNNINATDILKRNATGLHQQEIVHALMTKAQFSCARLIISTLAVEYAKSVTEALTDSLSNEVQTIESKADIKSLISEIDSQLEQAILDNADAENWRSYQALEQFRLAVISDLRTRGEQLANIKSVHLTDTFPALVVQYQHSGNSKKWQQLAQRNAIVHPLFCIGGNEVEVLQ
ncbi:DNA circularization protein [Pasteurella multocida]|uniref:DNA circularization protein n=1 Tax=Pasteurella multocida TaxID=747 RepID=UPI00189A2B3D|nr:DNA circularization N-terminal domain-containing protein [Pasteurella multocida]MBF6985713.1 DNA circularization protein [Pasteurella multocida]MDA5607622.1 DNA circularization N-terminal domain-containing protein [Pasteurella multocida subsp. multocida]MDA5615178.1 DNA circularization N-terminal domain-containing protein [Pasteurella multocida]MDA5625097.1 DNA circularization N-terminal domain-containing protein [Pasteurella multocida]